MPPVTQLAVWRSLRGPAPKWSRRDRLRIERRYLEWFAMPPDTLGGSAARIARQAGDLLGYDAALEVIDLLDREISDARDRALGL